MGNLIGAVIGGQEEDDNSKSAEELLRELWDLNHNDEAISIDWLAQMLGDVRECIRRVGVHQRKHPIFKWTAEDIKSWAKHLRQQRQARELPELLAVACRACMLANGYYPRDAQLLSILLMLSPSKAGRRGHLQQIATGEGKTAIVALFVVVKALRDRVKIDVVTSSDVLARRDAESLKAFYGMFGLTVDDCTGGLTSRYKECYAADILYGDIGSFQGDILYHEFKSKNVRGTPPRPFECIVIDEVDCMLVDDMMQEKILMLSFHVPGIEYLEGILTMCWAHFMEELLKDLEKDLDAANTHIEGDQLENCVGKVEKWLTNMIHKNGKNLVIPPHLRAFALKQIPKWMDSLKEAVKMKENCEYVIREGAVVPIDYQNTGTQQRSTSLSDGLHQFLQLKHGLRIDPETLVTSFITNPGFINRYKQIYGLSGTLGSNYEHSFLKAHYNVSITLMPTYKPSQLETMEPIIEIALTGDQSPYDQQQSWIANICENILIHVKQRKRAALVICLTNDKVEQLSTAVKSEFPDIKIHKYTDDDEQLPTEFVGPMDVIFSTNYAGRGTDIKTSAELEANGGLHVIVTFMPRNSRVERQAFGRTARQGKKGTAQLIILTEVDLEEDLIDQDKDQQSQLETLDPIFETDQRSWISKICESVLVHVTLSERAALILCLTNDKVKQLSTAVKSEFPDIKIHKYTDDDEQLPTEFVGPMDVIFSTNYAGRGTDIKTSAELEANGGLHVIVTFMPRNSRVERQAFGRTARQGKKGTAQLILNECEKDNDLFDQNMDIIAKRDRLVEQSFEESKKEALPKLLAKERLFKKFSTFIGEMRESTAKAVGGNEQILAQIEEHWGFWLREKVEMRDENAPMPSEAVLLSELDAFIVEERRKGSPPPPPPPPAEFRPFGGASLFSSLFAPMMMAHALSSSSFRCEAPFLCLNIFTNPSYLVLKGYKLDYGNAIAHLEKAIELDAYKSGFAAPAHYYMALALVKKGDDISVNKREARVEHQHKAAEHLKDANDLINEKLISSLASGGLNVEDKELREQIESKVELLQRLSKECQKWYKFISECPAGQFCKFKGWIKPDPDNELPQREVDEFGKFGVEEFYQLEYANPPKAWASIWGMYFLGAVQFGIGCLFALTGNFGLAMPFLQCGIRDLFEAAKAHIQNTVISWSKNIIDKILTYGPVFARLASSYLSTCKNGIGKWLFKCANWLGLAKPLATSTVGMGAFVTKVIVSSCTAELKQFVNQKTGISMPYLNGIEGLFRQGLAASLGRGSIQNVFKLADNCWRDIFKGQINRQIAVVARKVFGDGDGFMKNLAEAVCVRLVTNKFEEKFDKIADKCYDGVLRTLQKTYAGKQKPLLSKDAIKKIKKVLNDPLPSSSTDKRAELLARLRKLNLGREHDDYLEGLAWRVSRNSPNNCGDAGPPYDDGGFGPPDGSGGPGPPYDGGGPGPPYDGGGSGPPDGSGGPGPPYDGGGPGPPDDGGDAGPPVLLLTAKKPDDGGDAGPPVLLLTAPKPKPKKYALDCECVGIGPDGKDSMLARVSIVDEHENKVLDVCVEPTTLPIVDYRTEVSGIRPKDLGMGPGEVDHPLLSFAEALIEVKKLISGNILIGHQLDKDLKYLKMDHPAELTRDTAKAKFLRKRLGDEKNTPSLDKIYHHEFGVHMYKPGQEHNSVWDAKCPLRVYLKNEEEWEKEIRDEKKESVRSVKQGSKKKT